MQLWFALSHKRTPMKFVVTLLSTLSLLSIIAGNAASTQTGIGIQIYPGTNIIGSVGSVYSIQATTNTALPNSWTTVAVVKLVDPHVRHRFPARWRRTSRHGGENEARSPATHPPLYEQTSCRCDLPSGGSDIARIHGSKVPCPTLAENGTRSVILEISLRSTKV